MPFLHPRRTCPMQPPTPLPLEDLSKEELIERLKAEQIKIGLLKTSFIHLLMKLEHPSQLFMGIVTCCFINKMKRSRRFQRIR